MLKSVPYRPEIDGLRALAILPLVLMAARRWRRSRLLLLPASLALLSLGLAQWSSVHAPSAGYYLSHTRAWELLAGSLLALSPASVQQALAPRRWLREGLSLAGLAALGRGCLRIQLRHADAQRAQPDSHAGHGLADRLCGAGHLAGPAAGHTPTGGAGPDFL